MPDPSKRGGVSFDETEENRVSDRGTMAEKGRTQQFTSDQAREEAVYSGEVGPPPIEDVEQLITPTPGRGAGGSPVDDETKKLPKDAPDGLSSSRGHEELGKKS
jgi:hypothetical protein